MIFPLVLAVLSLSLSQSRAFAPRTVNIQRVRVELARPFTIQKSSKNDNEEEDGLIVESSEDAGRRNLIINTIAGGLSAASGVAAWELFRLEVYTPPGFQRLPTTQFLAALGDPTASEGTGAENWGLWKQDPGPRGVWLRDYNDQLVNSNGIAPRGWKFDQNDFWIEEHGTESLCTL